MLSTMLLLLIICIDIKLKKEHLQTLWAPADYWWSLTLYFYFSLDLICDFRVKHLQQLCVCLCFRSGRLLAAVCGCFWAGGCVRGAAAKDQPRRTGGAGRVSDRTPGAHPGGRGPALCSGECFSAFPASYQAVKYAALLQCTKQQLAGSKLFVSCFFFFRFPKGP